jgi:hypothetical protein
MYVHTPHSKISNGFVSLPLYNSRFHTGLDTYLWFFPDIFGGEYSVWGRGAPHVTWTLRLAHDQSCPDIFRDVLCYILNLLCYPRFSRVFCIKTFLPMFSGFLRGVQTLKSRKIYDRWYRPVSLIKIILRRPSLGPKTVSKNIVEVQWSNYYINKIIYSTF